MELDLSYNWIVRDCKLVNLQTLKLVGNEHVTGE